MSETNDISAALSGDERQELADKLISYQLSKRTGILRCTNTKNNVLISGQAVTAFTGSFKFDLREYGNVA